MTAEERSYWVGFSLFPGIGPVRFRLLCEYFGSAQNAWYASSSELNATGLGEKLTSQFVSFRNTRPIEKTLELLAKKDIKIITTEDISYPQLLKQISDPPFLLYVRSADNPKNYLPEGLCVGVVGTRKVTGYGRQITRTLVEGLVAAGVTIVSGLAYGVDTIAHQTAVDCGGKTIAVLGCGVDIIHPVSNTTLYWEIVKKFGAVISEYPPGQYASKGLFPARNRIISGISLGVVITEGAVNSGSLITAKYAATQGRDVFAVPGPINSEYSEGPVMLIKNGAKVVTRVEDILEELNIKLKNKKSNMKDITFDLTNEEFRIYTLLGEKPMHIDEIVRESGLATHRVAGLLTMMEMKSILIRHEDGTYGQN